MKFHHPDITGASHDGVSYTADELGIIDAPEAAAEAFAAHGLLPLPYVEPQTNGDETAAKPVSQWSNDALKAKAAELGLNVEGLKRPELIQAVSDALKA